MTPVPSDAHDRIEQPDLNLGFMPLIDCAPLVVALEQGFFAEQGLRVNLSREVSWANIRDKVAAGTLDGAQMLAPLPLAASLPEPVAGVPMLTALSLGLNGNVIGVSTRLHAAMAALASTPGEGGPGARLARVAWRRREQGRPLRLGVVFPYSSHNYLLRYWLAAHGLHPDRDVHLDVVPPPFMVEALAAGEIEGFCVGEPWGSLAAAQGAGVVLLADHAVWRHHPEKVFAVTEAWAAGHPATHRALLIALLKAAQWLEARGHDGALAELLAREDYVGVPAPLVRQILAGVAGPVFFRHAATFPWRSHALWFLTQMARWGQIDMALPLRPLAGRVYRPDLYREAAAALGLACPLVDDKPEGGHETEYPLAEASGPLTLGADRFCDGRRFDPCDPIGYLSDGQPWDRRVAPGDWRRGEA